MPDITAVILGNGGSIWRFADASEPDAAGWQSIPVDAAVIQSRIDGRSHGFAVIDDVGNEWTRQGEAFQWRLFPNRFFHSKDQNAAVAPRFEIWTTRASRSWFRRRPFRRRWPKRRGSSCLPLAVPEVKERRTGRWRSAICSAGR